MRLILYRRRLCTSFQCTYRHGKGQIRKVWSQLMSNPCYSLRFGPTKIEVAQSADLAYEIGTLI